MKAEEYLKSVYPDGLPIINIQWEEDMPEIMQEFAELKCKKLRHKAAEIAISDIPNDIKHSKIMNIKIEM